MAKNRNFEKIFQKDIAVLEQKINHPRISNLKIYASKGAILSGVILTKMIPFIASGMICASSFSGLLAATEKEIPMNSEVTITSTGIEKITSSFDYKYKSESLEYSTGWINSEDGLFKRTITTYKINDLNREKATAYLQSTKEELQEKYLISGVKVIEKKELSDNDAIYNDDMVIATFADKDWSQTKIEKESLLSQIIDFIIYFGLYMSIGFGLNKVYDKLIGTSIFERLKIINSKLKLVKDYDLEEYKAILKLKQENLLLFQSNNLETEEKVIKKIRTR